MFSTMSVLSAAPPMPTVVSVMGTVSQDALTADPGALSRPTP